MRRRIKRFLRTFFFFTQQEQRGIVSLVFIIFLAMLVSFVYSWFEPTVTPNFRLEQLETLEQQITERKETKNWKKYPPRQHFLDQPKKKNSYKKFETHSKNYQPIIIEVNSADSAMWVALPGIGPTLASRIIDYRNKLGGFLQLQQLAEVYGFKEDLLYDLKDRLILKQEEVEKFNLNTADYKTLSGHPYFKYTLAKAIINYRKQHGNFKSLEDIKRIKIVNDSIYERVVIYLEIP